MNEYFESQITSNINAHKKDPLMFYMVGGRVEYCPLSYIETLSQSLTFIELRQVGAMSLPVFSRN